MEVKFRCQISRGLYAVRFSPKGKIEGKNPPFHRPDGYFVPWCRKKDSWVGGGSPKESGKRDVKDLLLASRGKERNRTKIIRLGLGEAPSSRKKGKGIWPQCSKGGKGYGAVQGDKIEPHLGPGRRRKSGEGIMEVMPKREGKETGGRTGKRGPGVRKDEGGQGFL